MKFPLIEYNYGRVNNKSTHTQIKVILNLGYKNIIKK